MNRDINPFAEYDAPEAEIEQTFEDYEELDTDMEITKCPACGANMVFSAGENCLYCEHCGTKQAINAKSSAELAFERLLSDNNTWASETHVFYCQNCGAKTVLDKNEIATTCSFCGTTNIVETDELSGVKPNAVIPFSFDRDEAAERVKKWAKKKIYAPRAFRKGAKPDEIKGVYNPAFSFDTNTFSSYSARLGKHYYKTVRVNGRLVRRQYTRYFNVSGTYSMTFDDVLIQASTVIDQKQLDALQPFDTNYSNEYSPEYLSGFTATQYTKDGLNCWEEAKKVIDKHLKSRILAKYDYDVVSSFNVSTTCKDITYKYILIPVYVGHCTWRQKLFNFFVNGRNGKVTGKTPVSPWKVLFTVLGIGLIVGAVYLLARGL